ncbi:MAG: hypothetical protein WAM14_26030 [Candidatus Nitrosopolaris sp.]
MNKQIFITVIMVVSAVIVGIPAVDMQDAYANVNNLNDCSGGFSSPSQNCDSWGGGGSSGWGNWGI